MNEIKSVRELIEILSRFDPDAKPLVYDNEQGYLPIKKIESGQIKSDGTNYERFPESWEKTEDMQTISAVAFDWDGH